MAVDLAIFVNLSSAPILKTHEHFFVKIRILQNSTRFSKKEVGKKNLIRVYNYVLRLLWISRSRARFWMLQKFVVTLHHFTLVLGDFLISGEPRTPTSGPQPGTLKLDHHQRDGCFGAVYSYR